MKELVYSRMLAAAVEQHADRVGVSDGAYEATWGEHWERVLRLAGALRTELGLGAGDRFGVLSLNNHRFVELYHAAYLGAGIVNPLNIRLSEAEIEFVLRDSGTRVVFVDEAHEPLLAPVADRLGLRVVRLSGVHGRCEFEDLLAAGSATLPPEPEEDSLVVLMYTGGTTGLPKGVLHDQRAQMLNMYHFQFAFPFDTTTVILLSFPMFHAGAITCSLLSAAVGTHLVVQPRFDAGAVIEATDRYQVTHCGAVPTMLTMLLHHPEFTPERMQSLRYVLCGGAPLSLSLLEEFEAALPNASIVQGYGMTEAGLFVSVMSPANRSDRARLASVGRPVLGVEVQVRDPDDRPLPAGDVGEICVRGGNLLRGYWNRPEETEAALRGGWYHTGDAGCFDDEGYLFLKDRVKDMVISGGENVYPAEVEHAMASHPAVAQVAVIGIPHEVWGEAVHAVVVCRPGHEVTERELIEHTCGLIARYKAPKSVEFRDELPLSAVGKPLKRELRLPYWEASA